MEPWNSSSDPQMASGQMAVQPGVPFRPHQVALFVEIIAALQKLLLELVVLLVLTCNNYLSTSRVSSTPFSNRLVKWVAPSRRVVLEAILTDQTPRLISFTIRGMKITFYGKKTNAGQVEDAEEEELGPMFTSRSKPLPLNPLQQVRLVSSHQIPLISHFFSV